MAFFQKAANALDWYERGKRGFWLLCASAIPVASCMALLDASELSDASTRSAIALAPLAAFAAGCLAPRRLLARRGAAELCGGVSAMAALGACWLWVTPAWAAHPELAAGLWSLCAALGAAWGWLCKRDEAAPQRVALAYVRADGDVDSVSRAVLLASLSCWPEWAAGGEIDPTEDGGARASFPARTDFCIAIDSEPWEPMDGPEAAPARCVVALVWAPDFSIARAFAPSSSADPSTMRDAFSRALGEALPGCRPTPLA